MRMFELRKNGARAQGIVFDDGTVALRWNTSYPSTVLHAGMHAVELTYGKAHIDWVDNDAAREHARLLDRINSLEADVEKVTRERDIKSTALDLVTTDQQLWYEDVMAKAEAIVDQSYNEAAPDA